MLQYTNGFSCAMDSNKESVIIEFIQKVPVLRSEEGQKEKTETVSSLVMDVSTAANLLSVLTEMFEDAAYELEMELDEEE